MKDRRAFLAGLGGAFCLVVLTVLLVRHAWPLWTGEPIYLRVQPVDPRDVFRGDYVILSYPIQSITIGTGRGESEGVGGRDPAARLVGLGDWWRTRHPGKLRGERLYVQLERVDSSLAGVPALHRPVSVALEPQPDSVNLRGIVRSAWRTSAPPEAVLRVRLHYGIDAFFVQEGEGYPIEEALRRRSSVVAEVMVSRGGAARVKDLIIDGERVAPW